VILKKVINTSSRVPTYQRRIKSLDKASSGSDFKTVGTPKNSPNAKNPISGNCKSRIISVLKKGKKKG
jgi:hypothetical protein